ncbi:hypothetical protein H6P81_011282 [Aristolochia fimbriata]|uniref:Bowman-Birk serine protease inhibitors family domain-containing protein n=1 Tax=Aristolochia fimbriata TaxID=158543 RepID=A0AAV7EUK1_ARIFI|nr:hypothetical protein H6P81_011282 [Aristolochia fimbriata]
MKSSSIVILMIAVVLAMAASTNQFQFFQGDAAVSVSSNDASCCEKCTCAYSEPPKCRCLDVKSYCHESCKLCRCTKSIPPQCSCMDIEDHCQHSCKNK